MILDNTWFSEVCEVSGSAFSLKITEKLHEEKTPYQLIEIYDTQAYGKLMVIDGFIMLTGRDNFIYHEMLTHPVLYTHAAPRDVLVVGGGDCGTLQEVLKHPEVSKVQQVEIDEKVTQLSEKYFPELCLANKDSRAELIFADAIKWVREAEDNSLDIIIVDSTDPVGPAEGLFSKSFYQDCLRALRANGILVQQSESPLIHEKILNQMHAAMHEAGFANTQSLLFPQSVYPSGWWSATMAANVALSGFREEDVLKRGFKTRYYNNNIHHAAMAYPEFFKEYL